MYGEIVKDNYPAEARFFSRGNNQKCQFLLPNGCSVPPEFRPLCSLHTCERNLFQDNYFRREYFKLKEIIDFEMMKFGS